jgi:hypothetical protein
MHYSGLKFREMAKAKFTLKKDSKTLSHRTLSALFVSWISWWGEFGHSSPVSIHDEIKSSGIQRPGGLN